MAAKKVGTKKIDAEKSGGQSEAAERIVPEAGAPAPLFTLLNQDEEEVSLEALRGQKVVLYFYPRDNTPGCTTEALDFSRLLPDFEAKNTRVFGVSSDSTASHQRFCQAKSLSVPLLSDPEQVAQRAYGAWGTKSLYGRVFEGTIRSTFLIDEEGRIVRVWPKVRVKGHAEEVLAAL